MDALNFVTYLRKAGVEVDLVKRRFNRTYSECDSLMDLVNSASDFEEVIDYAFEWGKTPEGVGFWHTVSKGEKPAPLLKKEPLDPDYETYYMTQPWFLANFNEGVEICYVNKVGYKCTIPLECSDYMTKDFELAEYIVKLHNDNLSE